MGYSWFSITTEIDSAIKEFFLDILEPYWAPQNKLLWNGYRDISFPFERMSTPKIEMEMEWDLEQLFSYLQTWSSVRQYLQKEGDEEFLMRTYEELKSVWGDVKEKKSIKMDFTLLVGRNNFLIT